jgi:hypothetical protein
MNLATISARVPQSLCTLIGKHNKTVRHHHLQLVENLKLESLIALVVGEPAPLARPLLRSKHFTAVLNDVLSPERMETQSARLNSTAMSLEHDAAVETSNHSSNFNVDPPSDTQKHALAGPVPAPSSVSSATHHGYEERALFEEAAMTRALQVYAEDSPLLCT